MWTPGLVLQSIWKCKKSIACFLHLIFEFMHYFFYQLIEFNNITNSHFIAHRAMSEDNLKTINSLCKAPHSTCSNGALSWTSKSNQVAIFKGKLLDVVIPKLYAIVGPFQIISEVLTIHFSDIKKLLNILNGYLIATSLSHQNYSKKNTFSAHLSIPRVRWVTSEVLANQSCQIMERRIPATVVLQPNQRHGVQVKQLDLGYVALRKKTLRLPPAAPSTARIPKGH